MDVSDVSLAPRCHSLVSPQTDAKDEQEFYDSAEVAFPRDSDVCVRLFCLSQPVASVSLCRHLGTDC